MPSCALTMFFILIVDFKVTNHSSTIVPLGTYYNEKYFFEELSVHKFIQFWMTVTQKYIGEYSYIQYDDKIYLEKNTFYALMHRLRIIDFLYLLILFSPDKLTNKLEKSYKQETRMVNTTFWDWVAIKDWSKKYSRFSYRKIAVILRLKIYDTINAKSFNGKFAYVS